MDLDKRLAGQQTALDARDDLLELHKVGGNHQIISIKNILGLPSWKFCEQNSI